MSKNKSKSASMQSNQQNLYQILKNTAQFNKQNRNTKKIKKFKPVKIAKSVIKVNYSFEDVSKAWKELSCCDKVKLLTFASPELVNIHTANTYLLWLDKWNDKNSKDSESKDEIMLETSTMPTQPLQEDALENNKEDEFQLLNAFEIFWNVTSENVDLLKQNWGWKCATSHNLKSGNDSNKSESDDNQDSLSCKTGSKLEEVDFCLLSEMKIEGDVLTIKSEYLDNILDIWKTINPKIFDEKSKELYVFSSKDNMHKYINDMIKFDKLKTWKDFEFQLTYIIGYKMYLMYYALQQIKEKEEYLKSVEQNDKELFELFNDKPSKVPKPSKKSKKRNKKKTKKQSEISDPKPSPLTKPHTQTSPADTPCRPSLTKTSLKQIDSLPSNQPTAQNLLNHLSKRSKKLNSDERLSEAATTDISLGTWSDQNISDCENRQLNVIEEDKIYDPERDSSDLKRGKTKQKIYIKYKTEWLDDSFEQEGSDEDDPMRNMLKKNIHKIYQENDMILQENARELLEIRRQRDESMRPFNYEDTCVNYEVNQPQENTQYLLMQMLHEMSRAMAYNQQPPPQYHNNTGYGFY